MSNLKLVLSVTRKTILLAFLLVYSLSMSEKVLAQVEWDSNVCQLLEGADLNRIRFYFKFYENNSDLGKKNSFLENFEVHYSTDDGQHYIHLMSASTTNQKSKDWAWIELKDKKKGEKLSPYYQPLGYTKFISTHWVEGLTTRLNVRNDYSAKNQTWLSLEWYPKVGKKNITQIQFRGKWNKYGKSPNNTIILGYNLKEQETQLNSVILDFFNSNPKIKTEATDNTAKAYKEANTIVGKEALNEKIQVYTTTGKLVKSMVADCDVLQIPVPANQFYIVNVGQTRYKVVL